MEDGLDKIEDGTVEWDKMVSEFYSRFVEWMEKAKGPPAEEAKVRMVLDLLSRVVDWFPSPVVGGRSRGEKDFVESVAKQLAKGAKPISQRQLAALAEVAMRYVDQVPEITAALTAGGMAEAATVSRGRPGEATLAKMKALGKVECDAPTLRRGRKFDDRAFIDSLSRHVQYGRELSPAQKAQVDRLLVKYAAKIANYEELIRQFPPEPPQQDGPEDTESASLLDALKQVTEWKPPRTSRGRVFSDKAFYESLCGQFELRRTLSVRQKAVLKKIVHSYKGDTPDPVEVAEGCSLRPELEVETKQPGPTPPQQ
jgi:hypothetical protein